MVKLLDRDKGEKICILISKQTHNLYRSNMQRAKGLGLKMEIRNDFEKWFFGEQRKVKAELDRIAASAANPDA